MKLKIIILITFLIFSCQSNSNSKEEQANIPVSGFEEGKELKTKPLVSFTFDDGITRDLVGYKFEDWNNMILSALKKEGLTSAFFVTEAVLILKPSRIGR